MPRVSSVLTHPQLASIEKDLAALTPVSLVAKKYALSDSAIRRYIASHWAPRTVSAARATGGETLDFVSALSDAARDANVLRVAAMARGDATAALKATATLEKVAGTLMSRLDISSSNAAEMLSDAEAVLTAVVDLLRNDLPLADRMSDALYRRGHVALANEFRDFSAHQLSETTKRELER